MLYCFTLFQLFLDLFEYSLFFRILFYQICLKLFMCHYWYIYICICICYIFNLLLHVYTFYDFTLFCIMILLYYIVCCRIWYYLLSFITWYFTLLCQIMVSHFIIFHYVLWFCLSYVLCVSMIYLILYCIAFSYSTFFELH